MRLNAKSAAATALVLVALAGCSTQRPQWDYRAPADIPDIPVNASKEITGTITQPAAQPSKVAAPVARTDGAKDKTEPTYYTATGDIPAVNGKSPDEILGSLESLKAVPLDSVAGKNTTETTQINLMRDAAFSLGTRYGLATRATEINAMLDSHAPTLDVLWNFKPLMIPLPSAGALILPPVVEISSNNLSLSADRQSASAATKVMRILSVAKIVGAAPDWREYLRRTWDKPQAPSGLLLPRNEQEQALWRGAIAEGWRKGVWQADEMFRIDLQHLRRDYIGHVKYLSLVKSGQVKEMALASVDLGITGGGAEMKVGERIVRITKPDGNWQPVVLNPVDEGAPLSTSPEIDARLERK